MRGGVLAKAAALVLALLSAAPGEGLGRAPGATADTEREAPLRILFVGNSYLYTNDLPSMVDDEAGRRGIAVETVLLAAPDHALADHLRSPRLDRLLRRDWDWVVLQQGPSALPESRAELIDSTRRIAEALQGSKARIALFAAWPAQRNRHMSPDAEASYRAAAAVVQACVVPVASAWRMLQEAPDAPRLYQRDGLHPTREGSRLAAMALVRALVDASAPGPAHAAFDAAIASAFAGEAAACAPLRDVGGSQPEHPDPGQAVPGA